jgi:Subtilase family
MSNEKKRELVVIVKPEVGLRVGLQPPLSPLMMGGDVKPLINLLTSEGITISPLLGRSEERLKAATAAVPSPPGALVPDLSVFYRVDAPDARLLQLAERFQQFEFVEAAYVEPPVDLPVWPAEAVPSEVEPPSITPDFSNRQGYLENAPNGIDARFAWTIPGGRGAGVGIIDIEGAWQFTHEDLLRNQGGVVGGAQINDLRFRNHGTSVVGVIGGDDNGFGIVGICPEANVRAIADSGLGGVTFPSQVAAAITTAANMLNPGDIILIEAHAPGPRFNFIDVGGQQGYIAMQYWPEVYAAITYATIVRGVIVVEAAGNGNENLDDPIYSVPPPGFPPFWAPFNRANSDNAAIIVGAGAPPPGTHGRALNPDRSRLPFSNYGSCVDAQGWGAEVTTCGGFFTGPGDLWGGSDENLWYTDQFAGTSSASPIIVGALACVQGVLKAAGKPLLVPITARQLLQNTGSAQQDAPGRPSSERIGNRPNLFLALAGL